ncbi:MAG: hypothetical protein J6I79_01560 [Paludibacteraceae bacterium]|nr:hypothetical protein [Paludibacteraceae bacterium]
MAEFKKNIHIPILLMLVLMNFFELSILNIPGRKAVFTVILFLLYFLFWKNLRKSGYFWLVTTYALAVLGSCIYSNIVNHQRLLPTIGISYDFWGVLIMGYFLSLKSSGKDYQKIIVYSGVIFCCCYLIQFLVYPFPIFHGAEEDVANVSETEGYRVRLPGALFAYVLAFYSWQRFLLTRKIKCLFYMVLGLLPIIIMGFRSLTLLTVCSLILMIPYVLRSFGKTLKWSILAVLLLVSASQIPLVSEKLDNMEAKQLNGQNFSNKDYIRYLEFYYFYDYVFTKDYELFFGGGAPYKTETPYACMVHKDAQEDYNFFWSDLGLVGLAFIIGIPAVVLLIIMVSKSVLRCSTPQLQFVRFALLTALIGSLFTTKEIYRAGNLIIMALLIAYEVRVNSTLQIKTISK